MDETTPQPRQVLMPDCDFAALRERMIVAALRSAAPAEACRVGLAMAEAVLTGAAPTDI